MKKNVFLGAVSSTSVASELVSSAGSPFLWSGTSEGGAQPFVFQQAFQLILMQAEV